MLLLDFHIVYPMVGMKPILLLYNSSYPLLSSVGSSVRNSVMYRFIRLMIENTRTTFGAK